MSVAIKYTDSMHALLDWFGDQPCSCATVGHITDELEYSRETIRGNLKQLAAAEVAEVRHGPTGEYRLIDDPREDSDAE
jgi:DNA-binding IscR family transcriptional regulator